MANTGRPLTELSLTEDERTTLEQWERRRKTSQQLALRSRIILACAVGRSNTEVAAQTKVTLQTVGKWRARFVKQRLDGLVDEPRPGPPRTISDAQVEEVLTKTLESKPKQATHWSTRSMAKACGLTQTAVSRIWRACGLKPHLTETFKISTDPFFIDKVRDVVGLYVAPPDNALVICVDEKSQIQALDRTQPLLPLSIDHVAAQTPDYVRHGTTSLFAALNVATGEVLGKCYRRHRQQEFLRFLEEIDASIPVEPGVTIHLILDNYGTHKTARVQRWLLRHPRYQIHFTPTSASWINQVERFFAQITVERIRRGAFRSVPQLERAIHEYLADYNLNPRAFRWTADADLILAKVQRLCQRINNSGH